MNRMLKPRFPEYSDEELKITAWNNATPYGDGRTYRIDGKYALD